MKQMNFAIVTLIIGLLFLTAGVSAAQQITISNVVMNPDGTGTASIVMDSAPTGLAGFKLNLAITNPSVCDNITLVTYPSGFGQYDTKGSTWASAVYSNNVNTLTRGGFSTGYIKAMDLNGESFPDGSTNILLATVTLHGLSGGSTTLDGTILSLSDNYGTNYIPTTTVNDGTITVNTPPTAAFTADVTTGDAPLTVKFTDQSTGTAPLSYAWDFNGDRVTDSTEKNPETTFISVGSYPVNLTVTNSAGSSILVKPNYIIVTPANVAPVAAAQSVSMDENTAKEITLGATDADGDLLTFAIVTGPAHGTLGTVSAAGVVTYTPAADYTGSDSFTFRANDGTVDSAPATVTITVNNVNKAPVAADQTVSINENTVKDITLGATDADGDTLTYAVVSAPNHGTLGTISAAGVVTYTPATDYTGPDSFTFNVNDGTADSNTATVSISVDNVNKAPVASAQSVTMDENTVKDITLAATDADGDTLTFAVVSAPAHGTLGTISATGVVTYTPAADYVGSDSFTFKANDGTTDSAPATVSITVNNVNKAPVAADQSLSINENTARDITLGATDADGDSLTFAVVSAPAHGTLGTISATGVVTYTPAADYVGTDTFTFRANDGAADSNIATVTISVDNVNQAPVAADQSVTMDENTVKDITLAATDADGDSLTFAVGTAPSHGTLGTISATGVVAYTPAADYVGTDTFTFRANDGTVDSAPATVTITVNNVNKAPVAADQSVSLDENTAKDITLAASDADGDSLTFAVGTAPSHGTLGAISPAGVVTYTPAADYVGTDSFTFRANDGTVDSAPATVTITVNNVNKAPVAADQSVSLDENTAKDITLAATDADGDALTYAVVSAPAHGTLGAVSPAGVVTYTPAADYTGSDTFTFRANDGAADSNTATITITVSNVNKAPVAADQSVTMDENTAKDITLAATDADGDTLTYAIVSAPAHGTLGTVSATGVVTYTPAADYAGADSFTFKANDGTADSNTATVSITVNNVNKVPVANAQSVNTDKNIAKEITLTGSDADGDTLTYAVVAAPSHGTLGSISAAGVVTYTPAADYVGTDSFTFKVNDGTVDSAPATVDITVNAVNTVPVANAQSVNTDKNIAKEITLTGSDADGDALTYAVLSAPAHGTLGTISPAGVVTYTPAADYIGTDSFTFKVNDGTVDSAPATVDITVKQVYPPRDFGILVADIGTNAIKEIHPDGTVTTVASGFIPTGEEIYAPMDAAVDKKGNVYFVVNGLPAIMKISASDGSIALFASSYSLWDPNGIAVDSKGDVYVADSPNLLKISAADESVTVLGQPGGTQYDVAVDAAGTVYTVGGGVVRKMLPGGTFVTVGSGFSFPDAVAVDAAGNVYVSDTQTGSIKKVLPDGTTLTIGEGFNHPQIGLAVDSSGNVYVGDTGVNAIKVIHTDGTIETIASGFSSPRGVAIREEAAPNIAPVAADQSVTLDENTAKDITLAATDADGDALTYAVVAAPAHGTLGTISAAGIVTYTPAADFTGSDSFTFKANDGTADSNTATVTIAVSNVNKAPVAADQSLTMDENTAKDITLAATDADGDALTYAVVAAPAHGTLGSISAAGIVTYTPAADFTGSDSFTFKANDGTADSNTATVTITVSNVNKAPVAADQSVTMDENTAKDIALAATDADGDTLTFAVVAAPTHGTLGAISATGVVTYTPAADYTGPDAFTFKANDGTADSNSATVTLTVSNVNKAPVAADQSVTMDENTAKDIALAATDADGDALTFAAASVPSHGTLSAISAAGIVTYTPAADYVGSDSFTFKANDGAADSNTATVTITVNTVNKAPVAADQSVTTDKNTAKDITLGATDVDGDALTFAVVAAPTHGTLGSISAAGIVTYTPAADYVGSDSFTFKANDGMADSNTATVSITVNAVIVKPVVNFIGDPRSGDSPLKVTFTDQSANNPTAWAWDFQNDGVIDSTEQNPEFTFIAPGTYQVNLTASNAAGTAFRLKGNYITVSGEDPRIPGTDFTGDARTGNAPLTVHFTDLSTNNPTAWAWDFQNDGIIDSTDQNPAFTFTSAGTFAVNLSATNEYGHKIRLKSNFITITAAPVASMSVVKSASVSSLPEGGGEVTYTYLVENTGMVSLAAVTLADDKLGIITGPASGDANGNGILDAGETWTYSATTTLTATTTNTATATGSVPGTVPVSAQSNAVTVTVGGVVPAPEFPTIAFPVMVISALAFLVMVARKE